MTEVEYQKELLKTKIEAHRTIVGLEMRAARHSFDPLGLALSLLGFDRDTVHVLGPILHAVAGSLGDHSKAAGAGEAPDESG